MQAQIPLIYHLAILIVFSSLLYVIANQINKKRRNVYRELDRIISDLRGVQTQLSTNLSGQEESVVSQEPAIKVLVENMHYSDSIRGLFEKNSLSNVIIEKDSSKRIFGFIDETSPALRKQRVRELKEHRIVSFPYWISSELYENEDIITNLEGALDQGQIDFFKKQFSSTVQYVRNPDETLAGLPFTEITALLAYDTEVYAAPPRNLGEIYGNIGSGNKFGILNSSSARSHFYYLFMLCGSLGAEPLMIRENELLSNLDNPNCIAAIEHYLELIRIGDFYENNWNNPLDALRDRDISACFLWSEQIGPLISKPEFSDIEYIPIPTENKDYFNVLDGWFFSIIKDDESDPVSSKMYFEALKQLTQTTIHPEIVSQILSTPFNNNKGWIESFEINQLYSGKQNEMQTLQNAARTITGLLKNSKSIPQHNNTSKAMKVVSDEFSSYIKKSEDLNSYEIVGRINDKLREIKISKV